MYDTQLAVDTEMGPPLAWVLNLGSSPGTTTPTGEINQTAGRIHVASGVFDSPTPAGGRVGLVVNGTLVATGDVPEGVPGNTVFRVPFVEEPGQTVAVRLGDQVAFRNLVDTGNAANIYLKVDLSTDPTGRATAPTATP